MTAAKIIRKPAEGHGMTDRITDPHFEAKSRGEPVGLIPALVVFKAHGFGGKDTAGGSTRFVEYEVFRLEPLVDDHDRDDALWRVQALYEERTSTGSQRPLPIGLKGEERRLAMVERVEDWADANELTGAELEARWRDYWGIGPDDEWSWGDRGTPAEYRTAGFQHLLEFALEVGAEKQKEPEAPTGDVPLPVAGDEPPADDAADEQ